MWTDRETCWISNYGQRTEEWKSLRMYRLTASNFAAVAGRDPLKSPEDVLNTICGLAKPPSETAMMNMNHGTFLEPFIRNHYSKVNNVNVKEVGLAVYKKNTYLGASLDGDVDDQTCLEIKCPVNGIYSPLMFKLKNFSTRSGDAVTGTAASYSHIWNSHYDQMMGQMAITGKTQCDYWVYSDSTKQLYKERIPFNKGYWEESLYPKLDKFIEEKLKPKLKELGVGPLSVNSHDISTD